MHIHEWVTSLPWVIEESLDLAVPGVRVFAIDCEPLARHRIWLITGLRREDDICVVLPFDDAIDAEEAGTASLLFPLTAGCVVVGLDEEPALEAIVLDAYGYAMTN